MQTLENTEKSFSGLSLLIKLNWDRVLWPSAIAASLMLGTYAASL